MLVGDSQIDLETGTADEQFERLRQRFQGRLRKEQAQLAALTAALSSPDASAAIFVDVRSFAHRLRGAALVFGFQPLGERAKAVELAAITASLDTKGAGPDRAVLSTMRALAIDLAQELDTGAPVSIPGSERM